ncbi:MAG: ATP synthase F1 subunit gamma [bacterium]|nr:ATP synthase F1 subunit gamma [bacterium]
MPSLKEVRNKIISVGSTMQITSAMKMVSAAKLKRAQDAVVQMRPYANKLREILQNVSVNADPNSNPYSKDNHSNNVLIIAVSSNRGLAGAFNANVAKKVNLLIKEEFKGKNITVLPVGKKAHDAFKKTDYLITGMDLPHHTSKVFNKLSYSEAAPLMEDVIKTFLNKEFDKVVIVYNQFRNAAVQIPVDEQLLPVVTSGNEKKSVPTNYIFEPEEEQIINDLIPHMLKTQFYKALLDSFASEHGARMTAMHKATDNAKAMQNDLKIMYNKARQASITKEILEIVGGAEALNG